LVRLSPYAEASITWTNGSLRLAAGVPLKPRSWYRLWLVVDPPSGRVALAQQGLDRSAPAMAHARAEGRALPSGGTILFAAEDARKPRRHGMAFSP
jgi:N,N-dimethylformamidase